MRPPYMKEETWIREDAKHAEKMHGLLEQYRLRIEGSHKQISCKVQFAEGVLVRKLIEIVDHLDVDVLVISRHHYSRSKEEYVHSHRSSLLTRAAVTSSVWDTTYTKLCSTRLAACWWPSKRVYV